MSQSLEGRLASALKPVQAPTELWSRVESAVPGRAPTSSRQWPRFVMAAALAALMSGGVLYLRAQQQPGGLPSLDSLGASALALHRLPDSTPEPAYAVQRYRIEGVPVTLVSMADPSAIGPSRILSIDASPLTVSEWGAGGRRWALVSDPTTRNKQACTVCHRA